MPLDFSPSQLMISCALSSVYMTIVLRYMYISETVLIRINMCYRLAPTLPGVVHVYRQNHVHIVQNCLHQSNENITPYTMLKHPIFISIYAPMNLHIKNKSCD